MSRMTISVNFCCCLSVWRINRRMTKKVKSEQNQSDFINRIPNKTERKTNDPLCKSKIRREFWKDFIRFRIFPVYGKGQNG